MDRFGELAKRYEGFHNDGYRFRVIYNGFSANVFSPEMQLIITGENLPIILNENHWKPGLFDKEYVESYKSGSEYFKKTFSITNDTLYNNADVFIKNLHQCYYHKEPIKKEFGWTFWQTHYPVIVNKKTVSEYGFYAGILNEMEELKGNFPALFKNFQFNCPDIKNLHPEVQQHKKIIELFSQDKKNIAEKIAQKVPNPQIGDELGMNNDKVKDLIKEMCKELNLEKTSRLKLRKILLQHLTK